MQHPVKWRTWPRWVHTVIESVAFLAWLCMVTDTGMPWSGLCLVLCVAWMVSVLLCE